MNILDADKIIIRIRDHGGELMPAGGDLRYRGPTLTNELRALIRDHKPEVLAHLTAPHPIRTTIPSPAATAPLSSLPARRYVRPVAVSTPLLSASPWS